jgi:hypothetical protein
MMNLETASRFARLALGHVRREYPNKLDHVMTGPEDVASPRALHPIFYGSFDWHSCVHGYWLLTRLHRLFPDLPEAAAIEALVDAHVTPEKVAGELAYLAKPSSRGFERTYGWAWLLALGAELRSHESDAGRRWSKTLSPLADAFSARFTEYLPLATYPIRAGTHANSAFAITLALEWASMARDEALGALLREKAEAWFAADRDCQAWEPSGDDFLSPALMEASLMRRVLPPARYRPWLGSFLPKLADGEPRTLLVPATVSDRTDGKIAHLDGLNLSRAWCLREIAAAMPDGPPRAALRRAAEEHLTASLPHIGADYMGEHWLATFALLALLAPEI